MSLFSVSACRDFILYSRDTRDPKQLLRDNYEARYQAFIADQKECEEMHLRGEYLGTDGQAVEETYCSRVDYDSEDDTTTVAEKKAAKENIKPADPFSKSYHELPTIDKTKHTEPALIKPFTNAAQHYTKV